MECAGAFVVHVVENFVVAYLGYGTTQSPDREKSSR